jgi:hypothetical protein
MTEPWGEEQITPCQSQAFPSASVQSESTDRGSSTIARLNAMSADTGNNPVKQASEEEKGENLAGTICQHARSVAEKGGEIIQFLFADLQQVNRSEPKFKPPFKIGTEGREKNRRMPPRNGRDGEPQGRTDRTETRKNLSRMKKAESTHHHPPRVPQRSTGGTPAPRTARRGRPGRGRAAAPQPTVPSCVEAVLNHGHEHEHSLPKSPLCRSECQQIHGAMARAPPPPVGRFGTTRGGCGGVGCGEWEQLK